MIFQEYVARLLKTAFPHLNDNQIKITVQGLFNLDQDIPAFKDHLRDFLVQIRVSYNFTNYKQLKTYTLRLNWISSRKRKKYSILKIVK